MEKNNMKLLMKKDYGCLKPADEKTDLALRKISQGDWFFVDVKKPRNVKHHRKFWAMLNVVADNLALDIDADTLCEIIKIKTGHVTVVKTKSGLVHIPKSLKFSKMNQVEFDHFYERAIQVIVSEILCHVTKEEIEQKVLDMMN
jgi:hypothetical protein